MSRVFIATGTDMKAIEPKDNNGSIKLEFRHGGKVIKFNPVKGGRFDDPSAIKKAKGIALQVALDIDNECFDFTLEKYKQSSVASIQAKVAESAKQLKTVKTKSVDLIDLWSKYIEYKKPSVSPSTYTVDYVRRIGNTLKALPTTDIYEAIEIRNWLVSNKPLPQVKKILTQLNACLDWAIESGLAESNPFYGMAAKVKLPKATSDDDINPYTASERDSIIEAFKLNKHYSKYSALVEFIFNVGCRPSEALSLQWKDYSKGQIIFDSAFVLGKNQVGLKTQAKRTINLNKKVIALLDELKPESCDEQALIFPSPEGHNIDWHNFSNRAWKSVISKLPKIEYRNPYQMRHTFITLAIKAGVSLTDIAKSCGNSPKMILDKYAGVTRDFIMPEF
jgi:integrase